MSSHAQKTQNNDKQQTSHSQYNENTSSNVTVSPFINQNTHGVIQRQQQSLAEASPQVQMASQNHALANSGSANRTGLPDRLKSGIEQLSNLPMDDVSVHYNSPKPAGIDAHAYAQGNNIYLSRGQEQHLPHEAWHVVQQKQGRVSQNKQLKGMGLNDNSVLEKEADIMGAKAMTMPLSNSSRFSTPPAIPGSLSNSSVIQAKKKNKEEVWSEFHKRLKANRRTKSNSKVDQILLAFIEVYPDQTPSELGMTSEFLHTLYLKGTYKHAKQEFLSHTPREPSISESVTYGDEDKGIDEWMAETANTEDENLLGMGHNDLTPTNKKPVIDEHIKAIFQVTADDLAELQELNQLDEQVAPSKKIKPSKQKPKNRKKSTRLPVNDDMNYMDKDSFYRAYKKYSEQSEFFAAGSDILWGTNNLPVFKAIWTVYTFYGGSGSIMENLENFSKEQFFELYKFYELYIRTEQRDFADLAVFAADIGFGAAKTKDNNELYSILARDITKQPKIHKHLDNTPWHFYRTEIDFWHALILYYRAEVTDNKVDRNKRAFDLIIHGFYLLFGRQPLEAKLRPTPLYDLYLRTKMTIGGGSIRTPFEAAELMAATALKSSYKESQQMLETLRTDQNLQYQIIKQSDQERNKDLDLVYGKHGHAQDQQFSHDIQGEIVEKIALFQGDKRFEKTSIDVQKISASQDPIDKVVRLYFLLFGSDKYDETLLPRHQIIELHTRAKYMTDNELALFALDNRFGIDMEEGNENLQSYYMDYFKKINPEASEEDNLSKLKRYADHFSNGSPRPLPRFQRQEMEISGIKSLEWDPAQAQKNLKGNKQYQVLKRKHAQLTNDISASASMGFQGQTNKTSSSVGGSFRAHMGVDVNAQHSMSAGNKNMGGTVNASAHGGLGAELQGSGFIGLDKEAQQARLEAMLNGWIGAKFGANVNGQAVAGGLNLKGDVNLDASAGAGGSASLLGTLGKDGASLVAAVEGFAGARAELAGTLRLGSKKRDWMLITGGVNVGAGAGGNAVFKAHLNTESIGFNVGASGYLGLGFGGDADVQFFPFNLGMDAVDGIYNLLKYVGVPADEMMDYLTSAHYEYIRPILAKVAPYVVPVLNAINSYLMSVKSYSNTAYNYILSALKEAYGHAKNMASAAARPLVDTAKVYINLAKLAKREIDRGLETIANTRLPFEYKQAVDLGWLKYQAQIGGRIGDQGLSINLFPNLNMDSRFEFEKTGKSGNVVGGYMGFKGYEVYSMNDPNNINYMAALNTGGMLLKTDYFNTIGIGGKKFKGILSKQ